MHFLTGVCAIIGGIFTGTCHTDPNRALRHGVQSGVGEFGHEVTTEEGRLKHCEF